MQAGLVCAALSGLKRIGKKQERSYPVAEKKTATLFHCFFFFKNILIIDLAFVILDKQRNKIKRKGGLLANNHTCREDQLKRLTDTTITRDIPIIGGATRMFYQDRQGRCCRHCQCKQPNQSRSGPADSGETGERKGLDKKRNCAIR
ncbi:hypothetical protein HRG84_02660 [Flavisolibacter sp. BT320]|nr:hypothetical protein [Flavisolibacter longurius]